MPDDDDILEITWDDLNTLPPPAQFPAVDPADAAVAGGRLPWIDVEAVCARTRGGFAVRFTQAGPGVYNFAGLPGPTAAKSPTAAAPGAGLGQVNATFNLAGYPGCPQCGLGELIQCDRCATVTCGSALQQDKSGAWVTCPHCGGRGRVSSGVPVTVQGQVGGAKGGKGGKGR